MTPKNPAVERAPVARRVPPPAGGPSPAYPRSAGEGGKTSPQLSRERAAAGIPDPATGREDPAAASRLPSRPVRGRTQIPAGGALDADRVLSAGQMAIAKAMKEDRGKGSLDYHVRTILKDLGLWGFHPLISIGSRKGWPDWTFIGKWIMYRELKTEAGKLRPDQELVRDLILEAGGDWALWRPSDYLSGRIARELTAISRLRAATA